MSAVADGVNLVHGAHDAVLEAGELVDDGSYGLGVAGQGDVLVEDRLVPDQWGVLEVAVDADALAQALGQKLLVLHIYELILKGGAARVDDQYFHS